MPFDLRITHTHTLGIYFFRLFFSSWHSVIASECNFYTFLPSSPTSCNFFLPYLCPPADTTSLVQLWLFFLTERGFQKRGAKSLDYGYEHCSMFLVRQFCADYEPTLHSQLWNSLLGGVKSITHSKTVFDWWVLFFYWKHLRVYTSTSQCSYRKFSRALRL